MPRSFQLVTPQTLSLKSRFYEKKVKESLGIDMAIVKYGRDEVLNGDNLNFVKANIKQKKFGIILSQVTVFKIFENGLNQCV